MAKVPSFDIVTCPFVIARDNVGLTLIDVKNFKVYMFSRSPITSSLFGHGDILKLVSSGEDRCRILTVLQEEDSEKA